MALKRQVSVTFRGVDKLSRELDRINRRKKSLKKTVVEFTKAIPAFVAGAGGMAAALVALSHKIVQPVEEMGQWSRQLGESIEFMSEWAFAASKFGLSADTASEGVKELGIRVAEYVRDGVGPASEALKRLEDEGVKLTNPDGSLRKMEDLLPDIADHLAGLATEAEQVFVADELLGDEASKLTRVLKDGSAALAEYREEARELGATLTENDVEAAKEFNLQLNDLKAQLGGVVRELARETGLISRATELAGALTAAVEASRKITPEVLDKISRFLGLGGVADEAQAGGDILTAEQLEAQRQAAIVRDLRGRGVGTGQGAGGGRGATTSASSVSDNYGFPGELTLPEINDELARMASINMPLVTEEMEGFGAAVRRNWFVLPPKMEEVSDKVLEHRNQLADLSAGYQRLGEDIFRAAAAGEEGLGGILIPLVQKLINDLIVAQQEGRSLGSVFSSFGTFGPIGFVSAGLPFLSNAFSSSRRDSFRDDYSSRAKRVGG